MAEAKQHLRVILPPIQADQALQPLHNGPSLILPHVFLGSLRDAMNDEIIAMHNITHVLNVTAGHPKPPFVEEDKFHRIPVNDTCDDKILPFLDEAIELIDKANKNNGVVLVHCYAGVSRSPTVVIAYVMWYRSCSSDDAYRFVKEKRESISPNFGLIGQLLNFEKRLQHQLKI